MYFKQKVYTFCHRKNEVACIGIEPETTCSWAVTPINTSPELVASVLFSNIRNPISIHIIERIRESFSTRRTPKIESTAFISSLDLHFSERGNISDDATCHAVGFLERLPNGKPTLVQSLVFVGVAIYQRLYPADTRRWMNVRLSLFHRLRHWTNFKPTLIQRLVSAR